MGKPLLSRELAKESDPGAALPQVPPSEEGNTPSVFPCVPSHNKTRNETGVRRVVVGS
jgi:hypothetical protein